MRHARLVATLLGASALLAFLACSSTPTKSTVRPADDDDGDDTPPPSTTPDTPSDPVQDDGGKPPGRVFAHTADTLYLFDPLASTLTRIGSFDCFENSIDRMLDIAVDASGNMFGTSDFGFLSISTTDAKCRYITQSGTFPNSLGFVPVGTVDAAKEALVGYAFDVKGNATRYVRIDPATGQISDLGSINPAGAAKQFSAAGDVIGLSRNGNRAYVTVKELLTDGGTAPGKTNSLAEIDPKTGAIKTVLPETGVTELFGLGQWAGQAYGFSGSGAIVAVSLETGASRTLAGLDAGADASWFGAGVTTTAPTAP